MTGSPSRKPRRQEVPVRDRKGHRRRAFDGIPGGEVQPHHGLSGQGQVEPVRQEARMHREERLRQLRAGKMRLMPAREVLGGVPRLRGEQMQRHRARPLRLRGLPQVFQLRLRPGELQRGRSSAVLREEAGGNPRGHRVHAGPARVVCGAREDVPWAGVEHRGDMGGPRRGAPRECQDDVQVRGVRHPGSCQHRPAEEGALQAQARRQRR